MPELRNDPITEGWVMIATARAKRPRDFAQPQAMPPEEGADFLRGVTL